MSAVVFGGAGGHGEEHTTGTRRFGDARRLEDMRASGRATRGEWEAVTTYTSG